MRFLLLIENPAVHLPGPDHSSTFLAFQIIGACHSSSTLRVYQKQPQKTREWMDLAMFQ